MTPHFEPPLSRNEAARQGGFTVVELLIAASLIATMGGLALGLLTDSVAVEQFQGQSFQRRTAAANALRTMARELSQTTTASTDFAIGVDNLSFNLPATLGPSIVWGPKVTYQLDENDNLVREEAGGTRILLGEVEALEIASTNDGRDISLFLTLRGAGYADGPAPLFCERLNVVLLE